MAGGGVLTDGNGSSFQLGDCIGKGAFGSVYKGLNLLRGDLIAIKRVKLENFPKSKLKDLMIEIDLLKNLQHPKIVKYIGFIKTRDELNILLEYCESGSLSQICKKFGKFPETLVAIYVRQVLEGLHFLHEQGVIHRDIKAANILTTKDGSVKLADFGVATRQADLRTRSFEGSPYWMAPEVIELSGPTTASDIWSVGCTIVELLTGHPPYWPKDALHAMYKMVHDDHPPMPEAITSILRDFLLQCFQKDSNLRSSARNLLRHAWIQSVKHESNQVTDDQIAQRARSKLAYYSTADRPTMRDNFESELENRCSNNLPAPEDDNENNWDDDFEDWGVRDEDAISGGDLHEADITGLLHKTAELSIHECDPSATIVGTPAPSRASLFNQIVEIEQNPEATLRLSDYRFPPNIHLTEQVAAIKKDQRSQPYNAYSKSGYLRFPGLARTRRSQSGGAPSQREDEGAEDEEVDPFALIDDEEYPEDKARRDQLSAEIFRLISQLGPQQQEQVVLNTLESLQMVFKDAPDMRGKVITYHGIIPLIEILETEPSTKVVSKVLSFINQIYEGSREIQENLGLVGGVPTIISYGRRWRDHRVRFEVARFIKLMCEASDQALQLFISCKGLPILVDFLTEDYSERKPLIWMAINGISTVLQLKSPTPKNDFCRLFARSGLLLKLAEAFYHVNRDDDAEARAQIRKILDVFLIFSQADAVVKDSMATRPVLRRMMREMDRLAPELLVIWLRSLKNLSMSPNTLDVLQSVGVIEKLVALMGMRNVPKVKEIYNQALNCMFNLCRLDPTRQEIACNTGIVPHLQDIVIQNSPLKQFALPILCDLAHAGDSCRRVLWMYDGLQFYLHVLRDPYWQVNALEAISVWLADQTAEVESIIGERVDRLMETLISATTNSFANLLEPLHRIVLLSPDVIGSGLLHSGPFYQVWSARLQHQKALVRVNVLKILSTLLQDEIARQGGASPPDGLVCQIERLRKEDPAVLVREICGQVLWMLDGDPTCGTT